MRQHFAGWLIAILLLPSASYAQLRAEVVATGLGSPLQFIPDPVLSNVFYIVQQNGLVRVLRDGQLLVAPFADLRSLTVSSGEQGLLGMAFAPDTATSGRVFFNYTNVNGDTVVSRFTRTMSDPLAIVPSSQFDLRWPSGARFIDQPFSNHNGGHLVFGPDGYLYVGLGDGGSGNDPLNNAQNPNTLLGKMLRIDINVPDSDVNGYRLPSDNPFLDNQPIAALGEIWAFGLRNPWRYSFDDFGPGATGALLIADVGQSAREEVNYEPARAGGRNYGWRMREGLIATPGVPTTTPAFEPLTDPIIDFNRTQARSITGGFVYRGSALGAAYQGRYFFADFVLSRVYSVGLSISASTGNATVTDLVDHTTELGASAGGGIASLGRDLQGELYLVTFAGRIVRIGLAAGPLPSPPSNVRAVISGTTVTINWSPPLSGPAPTLYRIDAGLSPGTSNAATVTLPATQTSLVAGGVPPGTYYARLRSLNGGTLSTPTPEITIAVSGGCSAAPPAPTAFAHSISARIVTFTWDVASTTNGPAVFEIQAGSATGLTNLASVIIDGTLRSLTVAAPPGEYFVRLRGGNACGASGVSNEIVVTVP